MDEITIGIDVSKATKKFKSGTEYYTQEIVQAILAASNGQDLFKLYTKSPLRHSLGVIPRNAEEKIMSLPPRLWTQLRLSWEVTVRPPDVLFIPAHTIPMSSRAPIVTTIHDLGFKHYPSLYPHHELIYHNFSMSQAVKRASHIIAISEATKKDILKFYPRARSSNITVIHHGFNRNRYRPLKTSDRLVFQPKYGKYILFVGRLEEKKNVCGMVEAFNLLRKETSIQHKLVLAGRPRYGFDKVKELIESLPSAIKRDIVLPGYIDDAKLPVLLREADIFLFPTFFEGFGMPVLEAFASGVPVVGSNTTSIPEVAGDSAVLIDPRKPLEIASGCSRLINKPDLRRRLVSLGLQRARQFTWEKAGLETLQVLIDTAYHAKK